MLSNCRMNCAALVELLDRAEAIALPADRRRGTSLAVGVREKVASMQLQYMLPIAVALRQTPSCSFGTHAFDVAHGSHPQAKLVSLSGSWNAVDPREDIHMKRVEMAAQKLAGADPRRRSATALLLAKVVTPVAARAFQGLRDSMRRLAQLTKEIQKLACAAQLTTEAILQQGVDAASHCLGELRRLCNAHKRLGDVPASLEASVDREIRSAVWVAWEDACDRARKGGKEAQKAAEWAEGQELVPEPTIVELALERCRFITELRKDSGYLRFTRAVEAVAPEHVARKRARDEYEAEFGGGFVEVEPNSRIYVLRDDYERVALEHEARERLRKRREEMQARLAAVQVM